MDPEEREIKPSSNGNGVNAKRNGRPGTSDSAKQFESEVIGALMDKIGDAINDIAAAAVRELTDMSSATYYSYARRGTQREMAAAAVALGSIAGGIIASVTSGRSTVEIIATWCSVAIVNVAHLAYHYISLRFLPRKSADECPSNEL